MDIRLVQEMMKLQSISNLNSSQPNNQNNAFEGLFNDLLASMNTSTEAPSIRKQLNHTNIQSRQNEVISPIEARINPSLDTIINDASATYGVDASLIRAVIQTESNFKGDVVSHAGAAGYMQLMPKTAEALGVTDRFDAKQNIMGGTKYLRDMLKRYDGNQTLALAAYNAGPGNVDKYGGIPPFTETQNYVKKIQNILS